MDARVVMDKGNMIGLLGYDGKTNFRRVIAHLLANEMPSVIDVDDSYEVLDYMNRLYCEVKDILWDE